MWFLNTKETPGAYPNLLRLAPRLVSVPIFPAMTVAQADFVAEMLDLSIFRGGIVCAGCQRVGEG